MGLCQSNRMLINRTTECQTQQNTQTTRRKIKLLILGAGESGKSTIVKQMRLVHDKGFTADELESRKGIIKSNITSQLVIILDAMSQMGIAFDDSCLQKEADVLNGVCNADKETESLTEDVVAAIKALWADAGVQCCYARRSEYQLNDSTKYFIESVDRVSAPDYTPTTQDMLYSRVPTTGVYEISFTVSGFPFRVFDVGGQRSERRKWIHCFDDVHAVLYVVAINEYDQMLREDNKMNRLKEAMGLFESVCNCRFFARACMIVFFNKTDIFRHKIEEIMVPFSVCFQSYEGQQCYSETVAFLSRQFRQLPVDTGKSLHIHQTCATDSTQVQKIISSATKKIVDLALNKAAIL